MQKSNHVSSHSIFAVLIALLIGLLTPAAAAAGVIGVRSSTGIKNSDGNYLVGDGFLNSGPDCLVQCIYAGADGVINPPNPLDGSPTGDDQALEMEEIAGRYYTVIGEGYPFSPDTGKFAEDFRHALNAGSKIYCRAWNSYDVASATCYGDSPLYPIENVVGEYHDFGTWLTDTCTPSSSTTTVEPTTTSVENTTTVESTTTTTEPVTTSIVSTSTTSEASTTSIEPTTSTIELTTTTTAESTTTVDLATTTVEMTTSSVESTTTSIMPTTTTTEENTTSVQPTITTSTPEITTTSDPSTSSVEPSTTSVAYTTTFLPVTTTIRPPTTSIGPIITTSIPKTTTSIGPVTTTTSSQKTSTSSAVASSTTTTAEPFTVRFTADVRTARIFRPVQFSSTSNGIVREYRWRFGDGAESTEAHPQHIYKKKGIYDVTLTVTGDDGSTATEKREKYITVHGFCPLTTSLNNESHIEVLYKVRDRLLPSLPGMLLISLYYRNAVELTRLLENNPSLQNRLREMVTNNIWVAEQWVAGKPAVISAEQVEEIVQFLEAVSASSSVRLRNDIDMFIAGLNDGYLLQEFYIQVE